jgi:DNA-binding XRE family transcriptional regulator
MAAARADRPTDVLLDGHQARVMLVCDWAGGQLAVDLGAQPEQFNAGAACGARVRQLRLAAGLTQEALAERAGLGVRTVQALEEGDNRPRPETLRRLAKLSRSRLRKLPIWLTRRGQKTRVVLRRNCGSCRRRLRSRVSFRRGGVWSTGRTTSPAS